MADIAPDWVHEVEGVSVSDLLLNEDQNDVNLYGKLPHIVVEGNIGSGNEFGENAY